MKISGARASELGLLVYLDGGKQPIPLRDVMGLCIGDDGFVDVIDRTRRDPVTNLPCEVRLHGRVTTNRPAHLIVPTCRPLDVVPQIR